MVEYPAQVKENIDNGNFWKAQELLVTERSKTTDREKITRINELIAAVFDKIRSKAETNTAPAAITFGTSGWRGIIGDDYTVQNVKRVTQAVVEMMKSDEFLNEINANSFEEIKARGGLIGFDSRFMGPEFARAAGSVLAAHGIKMYYGGMSTTPELSAAVVELDCAFSINLTPSHNPFEWAGYKFNPADGGPAGPNITSIIEHKYEALKKSNVIPEKADFTWQEVDTIKLYKQFIAKRNKVIDLAGLVAQINNSDIKIVFDNVHGATRGRMERLLEGVSPEKVSYLRTEDDHLFGGVKPEPSNENLTASREILAGSSAQFKLGAIMDPDGDRVRFTDGVEDIEMNYFGAMALYYLHKHKEYQGNLAKSVATSNFANAVADKLNIPIRETAVGFKEFRPYLKDTSLHPAIVAFEESDGITIGHHTLEKDALIGALLGIAMVIDMKKNLREIKQEVMDFAGAYYPGRGGMEVDRSLAGAPLKTKLKNLARLNPGTRISIGNNQKIIKDILMLDGYKFVFDDNSWLLIRPSGTEPKVRFYVEGRNENEKADLMNTARDLLEESMKS